MTAEAARERIAKLLAIYEDRPRTHEGRNALRHAERLIAKYKLDHPKAEPTEAHHPEVSRVFLAFKKLLTTKPKRRSEGIPDFAELERRFTKLMNA